MLVSLVMSLVLQSPPLPYEDVGACPFECCTYREWTADAPVTFLRERRPDADAAFTVAKGERVRAITGIVVTTRAGRAQVDRPADLWTTAGTLQIKPGETLFLLTYQGEGHFAAWFAGRLYDSVEAIRFAGVNLACDSRPDRCNGRVVEKPVSEWWVRVRNLNGVRGWTREPEKFSKKDGCGG